MAFSYLLYRLPLAIPTDRFFVFYPLAEIIATFIVLLVAIHFDVFKDWKNKFKRQDFLILAVILVFTIIVLHFTAIFYNQFVPALDAYNQHESELSARFQLLPSWFSYVDLFILAPIFEELIFREYLYRLFTRKWPAFIISALLFAWAHSGFTYPFFLYLPLSLGLNFAFSRRKFVGDSMIVHALYNIAVTFLAL